jgi:DNA-binding NtrC family response regulator
MRILVVDDHKNTRLTLGTILRRSGHHVDAAGSGEEGLSILNTRPFDLVVTDLRLGDLDGMDIVERIHTAYPKTKVVVITAFGTIVSAVRALKLGAYDYVTKPVQRDQIVSIVDKIVAESGAGIQEPGAQGPAAVSVQAFIGQNKKILDLLRFADKVAQTDVPVLILGESGTGKELIARRIHQLSPRHDGAFVAINCGALPENLQESELFGHRKGAFTGAVSDKRGLLVEAGCGTLLLDEIAEMSLSTQVKILRALENGEVRPVGGNDVGHMKCRVLASTNQDLRLLVEQGKFRRDLLFRLNVMQIEIPALRDRRDDISLLAQHFLQIFNSNYGKAITGFTPEASRVLAEASWPGNVRELRNCIERAVFVCQTPMIGFDELSVQASLPAPDEPCTLLKAQEKVLILDALQKNQWNQKRTAEALGIGVTTLWRKIKKYGLARLPQST